MKAARNVAAACALLCVLATSILITSLPFAENPERHQLAALGTAAGAVLFGVLWYFAGRSVDDDWPKGPLRAA